MSTSLGAFLPARGCAMRRTLQNGARPVRPLSRHSSGSLLATATPSVYVLCVTRSIYLALGDSTGVGVGAASGGGYPQRLLRLLGRPDLQLVNLCRSGATTADVLSEQLPRALEEQARVVTIGIGINDVGLQVPDESFAVNLEE